MINAAFQGIRMAQDPSRIVMKPPAGNTVYRVILREVGHGVKLTYSARLVGGAEIAKGALEQVKQTVDSMFVEKVKEWTDD